MMMKKMTDDDGGIDDYNNVKENLTTKVSMRGESGSKENKTVEKYKDANLESSIFLALSKWKFVKQPVSMMCKYTVRYTLCSNK